MQLTRDDARILLHALADCQMKGTERNTGADPEKIRLLYASLFDYVHSAPRGPGKRSLTQGRE